MVISKLGFNLSTKVLRAALAVSFLFSALVGSYILATDTYLWAQAPTHADGLVAFVILDIVAIVGIYFTPRVTRIAALLLPVVQLVAMAGDLYMGLGSPGSVVQGAFHEYLLNDSAFMVLLVLQAVLAGLAFGNLIQPYSDPHIGRAAGSIKASRPANRRAVSRALIGAVVIVAVILAGAGYISRRRRAPHRPRALPSTADLLRCRSPSTMGQRTPQTLPGYTPDSVTLVVGVNNTVAWTNNDSIHHTVTSTSAPSGGSFSSGNMNGGAVYTHTFTVPGTYSTTRVSFLDDRHHSRQGGVLAVAMACMRPAWPSAMDGSQEAISPWFLGSLLWLLPVFLFGPVVFLVARWLAGTSGHQGHPTGRGALGILEERYARERSQGAVRTDEEGYTGMICCPVLLVGGHCRVNR